MATIQISGLPSTTSFNDTDIIHLKDNAGVDKSILVSDLKIALSIVNAPNFARKDIAETFASDVVISGDLTVNGTTTTVNTETINLADNIILLNSNETGTPSQNAGIEVERGTSLNVQFRFNESSDTWELTEDGSTYYGVFHAGNLVTATESAEGILEVATSGEASTGTADDKAMTPLKTKEVVDNAKLINIITDASTSRTFSLTDADSFIDHTAGTAVTVTIPTNATVAFPIGTVISGTQGGAGQVTIGGAGVTIRSEVGLKTAAQDAPYTCLKVATDTWFVSGSLVA